MSEAVAARAESLDAGPAPIEVRRQGALAEFVLNRPKVLNAFSDGMRQVMAAEIPALARNPDVYAVAITSGSGKAFCAGGDVRALAAEARRDLASAKAYFAGEYALNWLLECFSKPTLSLINGICMGSGVGISAYNTHRVAGENYKFAMPETAIGLFPDVGAAHVLAQLPWPIGLYLGLTGRTIGPGDAYGLGLVTHCIEARHFPTILPGLADAEPIDPLLDGLHEDPGEGPLARETGLIRKFFGAGSLDDIIEGLKTAKGAEAAFASATLGGLSKRSPTSLRITDRHIRSARTLDLRETLIQDYRIACRCLEAPDFIEGVRALIIDKGSQPNWQPSALSEVIATQVAHYFAPLEGGELELPTRAEMQAARV